MKCLKKEIIWNAQERKESKTKKETQNKGKEWETVLDVVAINPNISKVLLDFYNQNQPPRPSGVIKSKDCNQTV